MSEEAKQHSTEREPRMERRRSARYQIRGTAWFQWETEEGQRYEGSGVTRDISKDGAFIETQEEPPVGARLKVVVTISSPVRDEMQVRLCGGGEVRHVQYSRGVKSGFGAWSGFRTEAATQAS